MYSDGRWVRYLEGLRSFLFRLMGPWEGVSFHLFSPGLSFFTVSAFFAKISFAHLDGNHEWMEAA